MILKKSVILIIFLGLALFFRIYLWSTYPFGYDQVTILENAAKIKNGKFLLIGPQAGPAPIFTGPLIYYFIAILMFFIPPPYTIVAAIAVISFITGSVLYYLAQRYLSFPQATITFILWVFSPFIINLGRIFWNPSLSFLAAILVFFPLLKGIKERLSCFDKLVVASGVFLGYQVHFSCLFLYLLVFLTALIFFKQRCLSLLLVCSFALSLSLLPTLIFDFRHQWLNLNGLLTFLENKNSIKFYFLVNQLIKNLYITLENLGRILFFPNSSLLTVFSGGLFFILAITLLWKNKSLKDLFVFLWIIAIPVFFTPYRESKPEYYFLIQFPALLYLLANLLQTILTTKSKQLFALISFACYTTFFVYTYYRSLEGLNLGNLLKVANYLQTVSQTTPIKKFNYNMETVHFPGFQYLLNGIELDRQGQEVVISYPYKDKDLFTVKFSLIAIWVCPQLKKEKNYLKAADYLTSTPQNVFLYQDYYHQGFLESSQVFIVTQQQRRLGSLLVFSPPISQQIYPVLNEQKNNKTSFPFPWTYLTISQSTGYAWNCNQKLFFFLPNEEIQQKEIFNLLEEFHIVTVGSINCQ